jgi:hypothetical protein
MCGIASIFMRRLWRIGDKGDEGFFHSLTDRGFMQYRYSCFCCLTYLQKQNSKSSAEHIFVRLYCIKPVLAACTSFKVCQFKYIVGFKFVL